MAPSRVSSICLVVAGLLLTYAIYHEAHFLGFVVIGLLAVIGSVRALGRRGPAWPLEGC